MNAQDSPRPPIPVSLWMAEEKRRRQVVINSLVDEGANREHLESLSLPALMGFIAEHCEEAPDAKMWRGALKAHKELGI